MPVTVSSMELQRQVEDFVTVGGLGLDDIVTIAKTLSYNFFR